jgi:hypothetical protein
MYSLALIVFVVSEKNEFEWKMAATAGLSLTLEPMGKVSQNASSLKPLGANQSLLVLLNGATLAEKQQLPFFKSLM